jgi:hypothetical protein
LGTSLDSRPNTLARGPEEMRFSVRKPNLLEIREFCLIPGFIMPITWIFGWVIVGIPTAIVSIIGLSEGIIDLTTSDEDFYRIYEVGKKSWFC